MNIYIFPFDRIPAGSRIVIYGAGTIGCGDGGYVAQIKVTDYCELLFVADRAYATKQFEFTTVRNPDEIASCEYDYIVVAIENDAYYGEIRTKLSELGVNADKIIWDVRPISVEPGYLRPTTPNISAEWDSYYTDAEILAHKQFVEYFLPHIEKYKFDLTSVLDFPSGRGRMAEQFAGISKRITCCDANVAAIDYCRKRFATFYSGCEFEFAVNDVIGFETRSIPFTDNTFSYIYSWDAMVHFSYKWLDFYISEFSRILHKGKGYVSIHHSNLASDNVSIASEKSEIWSDNPYWRSLVSAKDIAFIAEKHGFEICEQRFFSFVDIPLLDCMSVLRKRKPVI
jgi:ubiquinone/menaquinone biosynthesis C-methylase UbiE